PTRGHRPLPARTGERGGGRLGADLGAGVRRLRRGDHGPDGVQHPARPGRAPGGDRGRRALPQLARGGLPHRQDPRGRRRAPGAQPRSRSAGPDARGLSRPARVVGMSNESSTQGYQSTGSGTWTEPGAYEVAPGVHRIPLPLPMDGLRAVNVYVIASDEGLTLVDGGWAIEEARSLLESSLASIGFTVRDIRRFLVTHVHRDHYTQAAVIGKEFG